MDSWTTPAQTSPACLDGRSRIRLRPPRTPPRRCALASFDHPFEDPDASTERERGAGGPANGRLGVVRPAVARQGSARGQLCSTTKSRKVVYPLVREALAPPTGIPLPR